MRQAFAILLSIVAGLLPCNSSPASPPKRRPVPMQIFKLDSAGDVKLFGVTAQPVNYRGRKALEIREDPGSKSPGQAVALLKGTDFTDGTIEVDLAGAPVAGAPEGARGFVGVAFRSGDDASRFEYFYLRPTNGRADEQLRRNHSTQYASHPDYPWNRLRKENPGVYEAYVDLEPGVWTRIRIVVKGTRGELYVNGASQPCLIVNDLKLGKTHGLVGLWIDVGTQAYFANLKVKSGVRD
jgi:hypothetical protein